MRRAARLGLCEGAQAGGLRARCAELFGKLEVLAGELSCLGCVVERDECFGGVDAPRRERGVAGAESLPAVGGG